jgi:N-methylhydantoinase B
VNKPDLSLEELADANKSEFDRLFATQMALGTPGAGDATGQTLRSPNLTEKDTHDALPSVGPHITTLLTDTYAKAWSYEIVEHKVEPGEVRVLCRLTAMGQTRMQFGTAVNDGNIGIALQRATDDALARCHADLAPDTHADFVSAHGHQSIPQAPGPTDTLRQSEHISRVRQANTRAGDDVEKSLPHVVETALKSARGEMEIVLVRSAMSAGICLQRDADTMIADANGHLLVGHTETDLPQMLRASMPDLAPGDVILHSDPYSPGGAGGHLNDWAVVTPIFLGARLVGFSSAYGHMTDIGSESLGSNSVTTHSIFGEGLRIPPIKLYKNGDLNHEALAILASNTRAPVANHNDLMTLVAATKIGEARVLQLCARFGEPSYTRASQILLERTRQVMRAIIPKYFPSEPQSFEDYVDDDGCGNGPFRLKVTIWREEDKAYLDWTGTDAQAFGPINLHLQESTLQNLVGRYLLRRIDPEMEPSGGGNSLFNITLPEGSLIKATFPAALGSRRHLLGRLRDVINGVFSHSADSLVVAAGESNQGVLTFIPDDATQGLPLAETHFGAVPARSAADGIDGPSWKHTEKLHSVEAMEHQAPIRVDSRHCIPDSGGAGSFRGGNGVATTYRFTAPGALSIQDDRQTGQPWGIFGGRPGSRSEKSLTTKSGEHRTLAAKVDRLPVYPGDKLLYAGPGTGGWGDPLRRPVKAVQKDVTRGLTTIESAKEYYGVVIDSDTGTIHVEETEALRQRLLGAPGKRSHFDFGKKSVRQTS